MNVESDVLINLESVERNYLKLGKSGVDEALCPVDDVSNHLPRHPLHKSLGFDFVRNSRDIPIPSTASSLMLNHPGSCFFLI